MRDDIPNGQDFGWNPYPSEDSDYSAWLDAYGKNDTQKNSNDTIMPDGTDGRYASQNPYDGNNEAASYGGYMQREDLGAYSDASDGYSYVRRGERIAPTEDYYSHSDQAYQQNGSDDPIESTKPLRDLSEYPGYVQRNIENTGYVIFGQDPQENIPTDNGRDMHSYSSAPRVSNEAQKNGKKSAKLEKKEQKRRNRIKAKRNRRLFLSVWLVMVVLVAVTLGEYLAVGAGDVFAMNRTEEQTADVSIPEDATLEEVTDILYDAGVIEDPKFFKLYCTLTSADQFGRGEFQIPTNMDYEGIINYLLSNSNRVDTVEIMFPEGGNILEFAERLEENDVCTVEEVLEAANSTDFDDYDLIAAIPTDGDRYYKIEGYLFPDTYQFYKGEDPVDALSKMIYNCDVRFSDELRQAAEDAGMTIDEVIIMASLVQAEASNVEDMAYIASIIQNRLRDGAEYDIYYLELDSTVYYPYRTREEIPSDQAGYESSYNTYQVQGLPDGPICNPGLDAIEAVLNPEETSYYYFCHDAEGTPYYASSYYEHQTNLVEAGLMDPEDLYG